MRLIQEDPKPTYLRLGKNGESPVNRTGLGGPLCQRRIRDGGQILVLATGSIAKTVDDALGAIDPDQEIFALETVPQLKPLGLELDGVSGFNTIVTVEEHSVIGGLGSAVLEFLNHHDYTVKTVLLGVPDEVISNQGSSDYMRTFAGLSQYELELRLGDVANKK